MTGHEYGWPSGNALLKISSHTRPYGWFSDCRFSFCTTPRCSSSSSWLIAPLKWPMRSDSIHSAMSSAVVGTFWK